MDPLQGSSGGLLPWAAGPSPQASWRPSAPASCTAGASGSPARVLRALVERRLEALPDRLAHARNREQVDRLLEGPPIVRGDQHGVPPLAGDLDRLARLGGFLEQAVEVGPGVAGGDHLHIHLLHEWYEKTYVWA